MREGYISKPCPAFETQGRVLLNHSYSEDVQKLTFTHLQNKV
jgi:hypothetical protein